MSYQFKTVIISAFGLLVSYRIINIIDHNHVFDEIINLALICIIALVFVWVIYTDLKKYLSNKLFKELIPSTVGITIIVSLLCLLHLLKQKDISPTLLICMTIDNDFNAMSIDFRKDGTYKYTSWCLGHDNYRGNYSMHDSIIRLEKNNLVHTRNLLIREKAESSGNIEKFIYQTDNYGKVIPNAPFFKILD